jgi:hypothetical protein
MGREWLIFHETIEPLAKFTVIKAAAVFGLPHHWLGASIAGF